MTAPEVKKLNSMRFLEAHEVAYETHTYDESITDGIGAAQAMGFPPSQVYKTLVVQLKDNEHALVMIALQVAYREVVAQDSIAAMTIRLIVWAIILTLMFIQARKNQAPATPHFS